LIDPLKAPDPLILDGTLHIHKEEYSTGIVGCVFDWISESIVYKRGSKAHTAQMAFLRITKGVVFSDTTTYYVCMHWLSTVQRRIDHRCNATSIPCPTNLSLNYSDRGSSPGFGTAHTLS
jgi:hypothetical protein